MLSITCLYFLKEASNSQDMFMFMKEKEFISYFVENLRAEQDYSFKEHYNIPIEIEYTTLGTSFETLRECLAGPKSLQPFTPVSFRVIQQIANVLQGVDRSKFIRPKVLVGERKDESMRKSLEESFEQRILHEMDIWKSK